MFILAAVIIINHIQQSGLGQSHKSVSHPNGHKEADLIVLAHLQSLGGPIGRRVGPQVTQTGSNFAGTRIPVIHLLKMVM